MGKKVNDLTVNNTKISEIHKWQNSKCGIFRWGCSCCHPHTDEQKSMWRRTRRVMKQMINKIKGYDE